MRKQCPCCEYFTVDNDDEIIVDICPVCFWQYDAVAQDNPDRAIGPNHVSLNQAKENFKLFGASEERVLEFVRKPRKNEIV